MSPLDQKQKSSDPIASSAFPPTADIVLVDEGPTFVALRATTPLRIGTMSKYLAQN
jgi:hypothetical protein